MSLFVWAGMPAGAPCQRSSLSEPDTMAPSFEVAIVVDGEHSLDLFVLISYASFHFISVSYAYPHERMNRNDLLTCTSAFSTKSSSLSTAAPMASSFSPYTSNGGTVLGVAGPDFVVMAADTRLSEGFNIHTRFDSKIHALSTNVAVAASGMQADRAALFKRLDIQTSLYQHQNSGLSPSAAATAQLLAIMLYQKRFFPFYCWNLVGGVLPDGSGAIYSYDPVGNYERVPYSCSGTAEPLMQPLLDNQLGTIEKQRLQGTGQVAVLEPMCVHRSLEEIVDLVKDAFSSATERDIYTGDGLEIVTITASGSRREFMRLKED